MSALSLAILLCASAHAELRVVAIGLEPEARWTELESLLEGNAKLVLAGNKLDSEELRAADVILLAPHAAAALEGIGEPAAQALEKAVGRGCGLVVTGSAADALASSDAYGALLSRAPLSKDSGDPGEARKLAGVAVFIRDQSQSITQGVTHLSLENVRRARAVPIQLQSRKALAYGMEIVSRKESPPPPAGITNPVLWTNQIRAARVVVLTLEPPVDSKLTRERTAIALLVARSLEWAAGRAVTVKIPPEMPLFAERIPVAEESRFAMLAEGVGYYRGREIAPVMGFQAADWLEREDREETEQPEKVLDALALAEGAVVADIGAGTGYFSFRMAKRVGPTGKVYATDLQDEMLSLLKARMEKEGVKNIVPILAKEAETGLPDGSIDLALMVDVYHELSNPSAAIDALRRSLRAGKEGVRPGRLVLVEYRGEDPSVPIKPLHRTTVQQIKAELEPRGFRLLQTHEFLPHQHVLVFERT